MSCDSVAKLIPLYYYGELTPEEEDQLDEHLPECAACAAEMEKHRAMAAALDRRMLEPSPLLMEDCRADLMLAVSGTELPSRQVVRPLSKSPWTLFLEALNFSFAGFGRMRQPAGAVALVALGFIVSRLVGLPSIGGGVNTADVFNNVRSVRDDGSGKVQVVYDETRRREVTGRADDPNIQQFLLAGSRADNAAVRATAVGLLKSPAGSPQAIDSLLNALANDPVDGVRLRALDAVAPMASDPRVMKTLSQVLVSDSNSAMRFKVIDVMMAGRDDSIVPALQILMQREDDNNVRQKAIKALKDLNASYGTF